MWPSFYLYQACYFIVICIWHLLTVVQHLLLFSVACQKIVMHLMIAREHSFQWQCVCRSLLPYDKELVKTKSRNIIVLHLSLMFGFCLHFFPWNLYSCLKTFICHCHRGFSISPLKIRWDPYFMIYFFEYYYCWEWKKKTKTMFAVSWLVLEHMECIVAKFNKKIMK